MEKTVWPIDVEKRIKEIKRIQGAYKNDSWVNRHNLPVDSYKKSREYPIVPNQFRTEENINNLSTERLDLGNGKFILPSDSDIYDLYRIDIAYAEAEDEYEYFFDSDYPSKSNAYSKWAIYCSDCKGWWNLIRTLSGERFLNLLGFLSRSGYPSTGGRPSKECKLAIVIRYGMTPKQRKVAYDIIKDRFYKRISHNSERKGDTK